MNKKIIKITSVIIAIAFLMGLFAQFAYMFAFAEPKDEMVEISRKLEAAEKLEQSIKEESGRRLRIMCEKGIGSYLDIIFSSESLTDFADRLVIANELAEYDRNMIRAVTRVRKEISDSKDELGRAQNSEE